MDQVSYLPQGHIQSKGKLVNKSVLDLVAQGRKDFLCMSERNSHSKEYLSTVDIATMRLRERKVTA